MFHRSYLGNSTVVSEGERFDISIVIETLIGHDIDIPGNMGNGRISTQDFIVLQCGYLGNFYRRIRTPSGSVDGAVISIGCLIRKCSAGAFVEIPVTL